ncbi:MAG: DNA starvation/stationary phase protection protein [Candidatus Korobacteraceae bacterium]
MTNSGVSTVERSESGAQVELLENGALHTPTDLTKDGVEKITNELRQLLADVFALYVKTKNFHWHMSGRHFRDYHLLLDEQAQQVFAMTDDIAERARKIGGTTIRSISDISRNQRLHDNNDDFVAPQDMLVDLSADNQRLTRLLRTAHEICDRYNDVATASLIETWIDETERRTWFLWETTRDI